MNAIVTLRIRTNALVCFSVALWIAISLGVGARGYGQEGKTEFPASGVHASQGDSVPLSYFDAAEAEAVKAKAAGIILPKVEFHGATIRDCLSFLAKESQARDPEKRGVNFSLKLSHSMPVAKVPISFDARDISVLEAVTQVVKQAELGVRPGPGSLEVVTLAELNAVKNEAAAQPSPELVKSIAPVMAKLRAIIVPEIQLDEAPIRECIGRLQKASSDFDSEKKGIKFVLTSRDEAFQPPITIHCEKIPLIDALRAVADLGDLEPRLTAEGVVLIALPGKPAPPVHFDDPIPLPIPGLKDIRPGK